MAILWDSGPSTVAEVRESLGERFAYTTVLTVLRTLEEKGYVSHSEEGRAHRYHPMVNRNRAAQSALRRIREKVFGGSYSLMLTELLSDSKIDNAELKALRQIVSDRLTGDGR